MEKQLLGGVTTNEFIDLNFEGVMNLPNIDKMTCALGRCWIATPRDGFVDLPEIGGVSGNDKSQGAILGMLISTGAPVKSYNEKYLGETDFDFDGESFPAETVARFPIPLTPEEQLFDALCRMYPVGSFVAARTKVHNADFAGHLVAVGVISQEYADQYRVCTAELFDIYCSFNLGSKAPEHD